MNRYVKYIMFISAVLLFTCNAFGQEGRLAVTFTKDETVKDSCCIYNMSIKNRSDSVLCILHSMFMSLTSVQPQVLSVFEKNMDFDDFSFQYSVGDTSYTFEVMPYIGELILPYQQLSFKIKLLWSDGRKPGRLRFEYIYLNDLSYRKFQEEMKQVASWYNKYTRMEKFIDLPSQ